MLLDVDSPIVTFAPLSDATHHHIVVEGFPVQIPRMASARLQQLHTAFQIIYFSSWGRDAVIHISPLVGLPDNIPFIDLARYGDAGPGESRKYKALTGWVKHQALALVDDEVGEDMLLWAERRSEPTLLVEVDSRVGITEDHVQRLLVFAEEVRSR